MVSCFLKVDVVLEDQITLGEEWNIVTIWCVVDISLCNSVCIYMPLNFESYERNQHNQVLSQKHWPVESKLFFSFKWEDTLQLSCPICKPLLISHQFSVWTSLILKIVIKFLQLEIMVYMLPDWHIIIWRYWVAFSDVVPSLVAKVSRLF